MTPAQELNLCKCQVCQCQKIKKKLHKIGMDVSRNFIYLLPKKYEVTGSFADEESDIRYMFEHEQFQFNDETIAENRGLKSRLLLSLVKERLSGL